MYPTPRRRAVDQYKQSFYYEHLEEPKEPTTRIGKAKAWVGRGYEKAEKKATVYTKKHLPDPENIRDELKEVRGVIKKAQKMQRERGTPKWIAISEKEVSAGTYVHEYGLGVYGEVRDRPVKTTAIIGAGFVVGAGSKAVGLGGKYVSPYFPKGVKAAKKVYKYGVLPAVSSLYVGTTAKEVYIAEKTEKYAGARVLGKSTVELGAFFTGIKAGGKATRGLTQRQLIREAESVYIRRGIEVSKLPKGATLKQKAAQSLAPAPTAQEMKDYRQYLG